MTPDVDLAGPITANVLRSCRDWRSTTRAIGAFEKQLAGAQRESAKAILRQVLGELQKHREQFQAPAERIPE